MLKLLIGNAVLLCTCLQGLPQNNLPLEIGLGSGIAIYQGDLSPNRYGNLRSPGLSVQVYGNVQVHRLFSLRAGYAFASLQESDRNYSQVARQHRNFSFQTAVNEFSLQFVLHPLMDNEQPELRKFQPYALAGAGLARLRIERDWQGFDYGWGKWQSWVKEGLVQDSAQDLPTSVLSLSAGLGIRFVLGEKISLFAEAAHRFIKDDYLDGFSRSANPKNADSFTTFTAGIIFRRSASSQSHYR